jgi:outer membrane lipoprotein-sorting protein
MKRTVVVPLAALLCFVAQGLRAAELSVDQIIEKYMAATGGYAKVKAVQAVKATGLYSAGDAPIPFVTHRKRPNLYRWDRDIQGQKLVLSFDGQAAWWINPFGGVNSAAPMPEADAKNLRGEATFEDGLIDYKQKGLKVELLGVEDVDGRSAYRLKVTDKDGAVERYFIDTDTFLRSSSPSSSWPAGASSRC